MSSLSAWFQYWTGIDNPSGKIYAFWSGFGSDIGEVTILGGIWMMYRKHNCHTKGCWRIGKHPHGPFMLCRKHHPLVPDEGIKEDYFE